MFVKRWINHAKHTNTHTLCTRVHMHTHTKRQVGEQAGWGRQTYIWWRWWCVHMGKIRCQFDSIRSFIHLCKVCNFCANSTFAIPFTMNPISGICACRSIGVFHWILAFLWVRVLVESYHWEYLKRDYWPIQEKCLYVHCYHRHRWWYCWCSCFCCYLRCNLSSNSKCFDLFTFLYFNC